MRPSSGNPRRQTPYLVRARHGIALTSLACLALFAVQVVTGASTLYLADSSSRLQFFDSAAASTRASCLPSAGRSEILSMGARSVGPAAPDERAPLSTSHTSAKRPAAPIVLRPLHRPHFGLLRERLRLASRDDVPG